ncbi:MAG: hypothetical protein RIR26_686, partial [Pseudomonadota bacterium]
MRLRQAEFLILQYLRGSGAFPESQGTVHLMLSGGKDSVALLQILSAIAFAPSSWSQVKLELVLHHFNHRQRAEDSDDDERLCVDLGRRLGWPVECYSWQPELQNHVEDGDNFQSIARTWRYEKTRNFAQNWSRLRSGRPWAMASAHHRRDHAETLLHNLTRGCGPSGLLGLKPWTQEQNLLRPLLWLTSEQLDCYIAEKQLPHREDLSNQSGKYTRNRLRHDVLAELAKINPQVVEHLWSLSGDMASILKEPALTSQPEPQRAHEGTFVKNANFKIRTAEITGLQELSNFLEAACQKHGAKISRGILTNLLNHVHKLTAGRSKHQRYIFALSETLSLTMT